MIKMARFNKGDWVVIVDKRPEMEGRCDGLICQVTEVGCNGRYNLSGVGLMEKSLWSEEFLLPAREVIKEGSRLKVREDLSHNMSPMPLFSVNQFMEKLKGKIFTVEDTRLQTTNRNMEITLINEEWLWSLGMFERVVDDNYKVKNNMEEEKEMEEKIVLTAEQKQQLVDEMRDLLDEYDYNYSDSAIDKIIDKWFKAKEPIIRILSKHPNWNADKFQVQFNHTFSRILDNKARKSFFEWIDCFSLIAKYVLKPKVINGRTRQDVEMDWSNIERTLPTYKDGYAFNVEHYLKRIHKEIALQTELSAFGDNRYTDESLKRFYKAKNICSILWSECTEQYISQEIADKLNAIDSELRVHRGHKTTKIVGKFCRMYGLDKEKDYGSQYAKYCDAMNPLQVNRHTILSVNPIDYLTMSFGNTWASCHTIDKGNKRKRGGRDYQGCYSSGTMSYMLDGVSTVFYTVKEDYNGQDFELEDKVSRNMFHFGEEKLIQGRIYPFDQTDDNHSCGNEIYKPYREIVQKIFADCLGVPNLWYNKKGTGECDSVTYHEGTHYKDTSNYGNCNVSYLRKTPTDTHFNNVKICIGHAPICVTCGREHDDSESISCCGRGERCVHCGEFISQDDIDNGFARYTPDGWCCDDDECAVYCEYHERYEAREDDHEYINGYGWICGDGVYYSSYVERCEECGELFMVDDGMYDVHGNFYCDTCAENELVYVESDSEYYPASEVRQCASCGEYFPTDDMTMDDCGDYYCEDCWEELQEDNEEENTEETA